MMIAHLNTGKEWSKKDLFSLRNRIEHGRTVWPRCHLSDAHRSRGPREAARSGLELPQAVDRRKAAIFESHVRFGSIAEIAFECGSIARYGRDINATYGEKTTLNQSEKAKS